MDDSDSVVGSTHLRWMGPTLGDEFPDLRGETQDSNNFSLYDYFGNDWGIVFMHPSDFTPVCTTEIGAAQSLLDEFDVRNIKICGFSCDDATRHRAWLADIEVATGQKITFPLFCDPSRMHAIELGVFDPALKDRDGYPLTVRSVFIINPRKEIALTMTYPSTVGRNFDEILRVCDALQRVDRFGVATPANWNPGDKTIVSTEISDDEAVRRFGKSGYKAVDLPSEKGKVLSNHYLRYTDDPVLTAKGRQSFKLAVRMTKPKFSWRPPKSVALTLLLPGKRRGQSSAVEEDIPKSPESSSFTTQVSNDTSSTSRSPNPTFEPLENTLRPSVDYSNHKPWKMLLRPFTTLNSEAGIKHCQQRSKSELLSEGCTTMHCQQRSKSELLVDFGEKQNSADDAVVW